jgi:sulfur-oxidizing protein SoxY
VTDIKRRSLLKGTLAAGAVGAAVSAGLITPSRVLAAWPKSAFEAKTVDEALNGVYQSAQLTGSDAITIKAPDIAENGAVVPITVSTTLADVDSISIVVEKNAAPLAATFQLAPGTEAYASTRIKMGKTSSVIAVVKAGGKLHSAGKEVKVTIGGCGG